MIKVTYAITVSSEVEEFERLLDSLLSWKDANDEIVVLVDITKGCSDQIRSICRDYNLSWKEVSVFESKFEGNFADWKNTLNTLCTGEWIFQLDADELPTEVLVRKLHQILDGTEAELIAVPRQNIVDGIGEEDIRRWHWVRTPYGINWPDYQYRIYRNVDSIKWQGKVHERPVGYQKYAFISDKQFDYRIDHFKNIEKQRAQNNYYLTLT